MFAFFNYQTAPATVRAVASFNPRHVFSGTQAPVFQDVSLFQNVHFWSLFFIVACLFCFSFCFVFACRLLFTAAFCDLFAKLEQWQHGKNNEENQVEEELLSLVPWFCNFFPVNEEKFKRQT